jgi:glycogen(starch) synthase
MKQLIISREYPPAAYPPGGIGTYVHNIARLLAEAGETVHVIGERWKGAPLRREESYGGRLIVHRVAREDAVGATNATERWRTELNGLRRSRFSAQWFSLQAALLTERLIDEEDIDVIEGQEWEAPLYYFLLRRALGLGPKRQPPCFVHLHSPVELIVHFNGWDISRPGFITSKRMEDYCIRAAEGLLCPSDFLAREREVRYRLPSGSVQVISLPIGHTPFITRGLDTWERGSICYVGRLEPRKGVIEWVDAAVRVASDTPSVAFDFIGSDMPAGPFNTDVSMRRYLEARIPRALRRRFRFHGLVPRERIPELLARARAAVVPSRWENFPNSCIEAMATGLPVIATRFGGMAQMVEDGVSGWLADSTDVSSMVPGLSRALQRCLASTPEQRQAMGTAAVSAIRGLCDNRRTIEAHLAFRARIAHNGRARVGKVSVGGVAVPAHGAKPAASGRRQGIGVIARVAPAADGQALLDSLKRQSREPAVLVVAGRQDTVLQTQTSACGGSFLPVTADGAGGAWNAAFAEASASVSPVGWMFLDENDRLQPDALERLEAALLALPDLGLVSCWTGIGEKPARLLASPNPELPYQWLADDAARAAVFRAEALPLSAPFGTDPIRGAELWELTLLVLLQGWAAVTYPAMLAERAHDDIRLQWSDAVTFRERRVELARRHAAALAEDVPTLIDLYVPAPTEPLVVPSAWQRLRRTPQVRRLRRLITRAQHVGDAVQRRLRRLALKSQVTVPTHKETL